MKKYLITSLVLMLTLGLTGCVGDADEEVSEQTATTETAEKIKDQDNALIEAINIQIEAGDLAGLQEVALTIGDTKKREDALLLISTTQKDSDLVKSVIDLLDAGNIEEAKLKNENIKNDLQSRDTSWWRIAQMEVSQGDIAKAKETISKVSDTEIRDNIFLKQIAKNQARAGDIEGAKAMSNEMENPDVGLANIAYIQAEMGDPVGAKETVEEIKDPNFKIYILEKIAELEMLDASDSESIARPL